MLTGILQSIVLPLLNTDQDPFYQQNGDRYITEYCLTSFQYRSTQNADRYIAEYCLTSFQYSSRPIYQQNMLTGILQCIVLPLLNTDQDPFYQQNGDRYIAEYCLTSFRYSSRPILPTEC